MSPPLMFRDRTYLPLLRRILRARTCEALERQVRELEISVDRERRCREFYQRRCEAMQAMQPAMRDPERKMVCDVLANGRRGDVPCGLASQP